METKTEWYKKLAKRFVTQRAGGSLPFGYESWKVIERS